MKKVAVSIYANENFSLNILKNLKEIDFIHVDVMDGKFVNNINLNLDVFKIIHKNLNIPIIAHLMVVNPFEYIDEIINYIDYFLFHFETNIDKTMIIDEIKNRNKKIGFAINPTTHIYEVVSFLGKIDIVLVMGVNPGWSGQKFMPITVKKVNELSKYKSMYRFLIDVDGGVNLENAKFLKNADILSSATTIINSKTPNLIIQQFKDID